MALGVLTRASIERALREYDELGRDQFLARHGFGRATSYALVVDGREYDPKAIAGVAYGFDHPEDGPLSNTQFSGGIALRSAYRPAGFDVVLRTDPDETVLRDLLEHFMAEYRAARSEGYSGKHPAAAKLDLIRQVLVASGPVRERVGIKVDRSVGKGNWAAAPWIAFLDPRETTSTRSGVYPALLFREDMSGVYMTLAQGTQELKRQGKSHMLDALGSVAARIRQGLDPEVPASGFLLDSSITLGPRGLAKDYEASAIVHKLYERGSVPGDAQIYEDLDAVLTLSDDNIAWKRDSLRSRQVHLLVLDGSSTNPVDGTRHPEGTDPAGSFWWRSRSDSEGQVVSSADVATLRGQLSAGLTTQVYLRLGRSCWRATLLDVGDAEPHDDLVLDYDDRSREHHPSLELVDVTQLDDEFAATHLRLVSTGLPPSGALGSALVTVNESAPAPLSALVSRFSADVRSSGLDWGDDHDELVATFTASLLAKRFVILTGLSGSGKTMLARSFGQWLGADSARTVPVRPDWTSPDATIGYRDGLAGLRQADDYQEYWVVPDVLEHLLAAVCDPDRPYLLVLDEMNLAQVERYFAEMLSGIESGDPVVPNAQRLPDGRWVRDHDRPLVPWPDNVFTVGTVNVDETTYAFSPKVLDRANTIDFRVPTSSLRASGERRAVQPGAPAEGASFLAMARGPVDVSDSDEFQDRLRSVHCVLAKHRFEFGHRVFQEVLRYRYFALQTGVLTTDDQVLDHAVVQKVLPRLHGAQARVQPVLEELRQECFRDGVVVLPRVHEALQRMIDLVTTLHFVAFTD